MLSPGSLDQCLFPKDLKRHVSRFLIFPDSPLRPELLTRYFPSPDRPAAFYFCLIEEGFSAALGSPLVKSWRLLREQC